MKVDLVLASDHRGLELKEKIAKWLVPIDDTEVRSNITMFYDAGTYTPKSVDYPDIVKTFASEMETFNRGILFCGSGLGVCISANRYKHIRAVTVRSKHDAEMARLHNDANVLCIGADFTSSKKAIEIIKTFLDTKFEGGRHKRRVNKMANLGNQ
mgnify:FL=1